MNNLEKQKYVPCELNVVEFKVERGFAGSGANGMQGILGTDQGTTNMLWSMSAQQGSDQISHYRNEQYQDDFNWF